MNFIITYNIADTSIDKRATFEKKIETAFPNSQKETSNQTTMIGTVGKSIDEIKTILNTIVTSISLQANDAVTIYYPTLNESKPTIEKSIIYPAEIKEGVKTHTNRESEIAFYIREIN